jgi:DNA-binding NtrC family response regulator
MAKNRLLIIDERPTIRWALRNYFESWGYEVAEAESGSEALAQAERFHPDAVAMDCHVQAEDGNRLMEQVKASLAGIPMVLVARYESVERAMRVIQGALPDHANADLPLIEIEKKHIQAVLRNNRDNVEKAAVVLGISRSSLYERIKRYGIRSS